jgi:transcription factor C subunit 7
MVRAPFHLRPHAAHLPSTTHRGNLGLSEWYHPVEPGTGLHPRPSSASALKAYFPEIDDSWSSVWYPSRKGEDLDALQDRLAGFVSAFVPEVQRRFAGATAHKQILFVGHAATVIGLARAWVGDRSISFRAACCSITVLDRKAVTHASIEEGAVVGAGGAGGDWTPRILGGGDHLKDGLQRDWGLEDVVIADGKVSHCRILRIAHP